jgi:hypothetical protein
MQPSDPEADPPLHPIRESVGFLSAAIAALGRLCWPSRRRAASGAEQPVSEAEAVDLVLTEKVNRVAPYPVND